MSSPELPSLNAHELVPDLAPYIFEGEHLINVEHIPLLVPDKHPSAIKALLSLTSVQSTRDIGKNGPSIASRARATEQHIGHMRMFEKLFGRDSLFVANFVEPYYPALLEATIIALAERQGTGWDPSREMEPGSIVHEDPDPTDPNALRLTLGEGRLWPYHGTVDAPPLFLSSIAKVLKRKPDFLSQPYIDRNGNERTIWDAFLLSHEWLDRRLRSNPEGLLEFKNKPEAHGLINQAWKDSWDAYMHADGTIANHNAGIASVDVLALAYDALLDQMNVFMSVNYKKSGDLVSYLSWQANNLRKRVLQDFWAEDERGGYFVLGTDRDEQGHLRQLRVRTSNMGHLLDSGILMLNDKETIAKKEATIRTLFSSEMRNASGIRTLSNREARYRPSGYHTGNVWLWEQVRIANGLVRHGYYGLAYELYKNVRWDLHFTKRQAEFHNGGNDPLPILNMRIVDIYDTHENKKNRIEQLAHDPQAWTVAADLHIKHLNNPFHPERLPKAAIDPQKRRLELELLGIA